MIIKHLHMTITFLFIFVSVASLLACVQILSNYFFPPCSNVEVSGVNLKEKLPQLSPIFNADLLDWMEVMPVCGFLLCSYLLTLQHFHSVCTED